MSKEFDFVKEKAVNIRNKLGTTSLYIIGLTATLLLGLYIRTRNLKWLQGKYLLGLDPYAFYHYAGIIVEKGSLMAQDMMRYVPVGYILRPSDKFFSYCLAYAYKLLAWTGIDRMNMHIWYPAIAGLIGLVFLFLFVRELFGNKVALVSTLFLAVIPAYIYRTGAGFADHEALAMVWLFAALWLFARAWRVANKDSALWKGLACVVGSGIFTIFLTLTWGGYKYLFATISIFIILMFLCARLKKEHLYVFWGWFIFAIASLYLRNSGRFNFVKGYEFLLLCFAAVASILYYLLVWQVKNKFKFLDDKIAPAGLLAIGVATVVGIFGVLVTGILDLGVLYDRVLHPTGATRLAFTVSENAQPYFFGSNGWYASIGLTIFIALAGAILVFYHVFSGDRKYASWLTAGWIITLFAFVMGRYRAGSSINALFANSYLYIFVGFIALIGGVYLYLYRKDRKSFTEIFNARWELLLIFSWFIFSLVIARGAVRTIMAFAPVAAVMAGYFIVKTCEWLWSNGRKASAVVLIIFAAFCVISNAGQAKDMNEGSGSGFPGQWEGAMSWLRNESPADSVIAHWWDYGYWTLAMGERASVVDGGNAMRWNHQMGRQGLLGRNASEYLSYYKTHGVTHLLISEEEIGKFHAFATVGSDENFDLKSTIGLFGLQEEREARNGSQLIYQGGWPLDKDYVVNGKVFPEGGAIISNFVVNKVGDSLSGTALAVLYDGTNQYPVPLKCVCSGGQCYELDPDGFGGCFVMVPKYTSNNQANPVGGGFFISEKVEDSTLAKIYLKGETLPYFKEVYNDGTPLGFYGGNIVGPIRIWEIQYPDGVETNDKYLERSPYG